MKFIDAKGRILGKINIIDFLVIIFFISSLSIIFLKIQLHKRFAKQFLLQKENVELELKVKFIQMDIESAGLLRVKDKEYNRKGEVTAEIISLGNKKPYARKIILGTGYQQCVYDPVLFERAAKIKLKAQYCNKGYCYYKGSLLENGYFLYFVFNRRNYVAVVDKDAVVAVDKSVEAPQKEIVWIPVKIMFSGISPEIKNMLAMDYYELGKNNVIIARILGIINVQPYSAPEETLKDKKNKKKNKEKKNIPNDIIVNAELMCEKRDGLFFYNDAPLVVGAKIEMKTNLVLSGKIIKIANK